MEAVILSKKAIFAEHKMRLVLAFIVFVIQFSNRSNDGYRYREGGRGMCFYCCEK